MIVFSAIVPHPPILIPTIGKENLKQLKQTVEAMKQLEQELYASKPDVILVISPHGAIIPDAFSINLNSEYKVGFEDFGDFATKMKFKSSPMLVMEIKDRTMNEFPLALLSDEKLDHGAGVPLYFLAGHLPNVAIIPLFYSLLDYNSHFEFGKLLKRELAKSNKRIAVIASGDLSHRLTKDAPAGYSAEGKVFDKKLVDLIGKKDVKGILKLDPKLIEEAGECGLRSFIILLGILEDQNYTPEVLSYEGPFGVGYLVANFKIK